MAMAMTEDDTETRLPPARPTVVAFVVTPGASTFLTRTLAGLAAQRRAPDVVVVVDVGAPGGELGSGIPIEEIVHDTGLDSVSSVRVVRAPGAATFGAAVDEGRRRYQELVERSVRRARTSGFENTMPRPLWRGVTGELSPVTSRERAAAGLDAPRRADAPPSGAPRFRDGAPGAVPGAFPEVAAGPDGRDDASWMWLLHDDSAPAPAALAMLLRATEHARSVAVAGCKQRGWADPDLLLEVGLATTRTARRALDLDEDEIDQGQHDDREDVLAVGTAGMLVRPAVWDELGGTDPVLGPFGDGLEFCRRVRLAGHRVVVAPAAVVHHARASFEGLRRGRTRAGERPITVRGRRHEGDGGAAGGTAAAHGSHAVPAHGHHGHSHLPDTRRSYRARRTAQMHNALVAARGLLVPLLLIGYVLLAPVRALGRVATKEPGLALAEIGAVLDLLRDGGAVGEARRRVAAVRTRPDSELRRLQITGADIRRAKREDRRHRAALRRAREAPSELEMAERAALARRRRTWVAVLVPLLLVAGLALSGRLFQGIPAGAALAALPDDPARLWESARSSWVDGGLGAPGPADPLLSVLAVFAGPFLAAGLPAGAVVAGILVLAPLAAGIGAWAAAGAATRRTRVRAWAAVTWALGPTLLLGILQGRLGTVLAAAALPWVALSIAWMTGTRRRDVVLPGLVGARRRRVPVAGPELPPGIPRELDVFADLLTEGEDSAALVPAAAPSPTASERSPAARRAAPADVASADVASADAGTVGSWTGTLPDDDLDPPAPDWTSTEVPAAPAPSHDAAPARHGSGQNLVLNVMATAGGGLALAIACAGHPALLPAAVVLVPLLAICAPRGRRYLPLLLVPPLVLFAPVLIAVALDPTDQAWRALLADPGVPLATAPAEGWQALFGAPEHPTAGIVLPELVGVPDEWREAAVRVGAALVALALVALARPGPPARAARAGWLVAAVGLLTHLAVTRVDVAEGLALGGRPTVVAGWGGAGTLLVTAGLLLAVLAADGARPRPLQPRRRGEPRRTVPAARRVAGVLAVVLALAPVAGGAALVAVAATAADHAVQPRARAVPALTTQLYDSPDRSRTLRVTLGDDGIEAGVLRGTGRLLTTQATLPAARDRSDAAGPSVEATAVRTVAALAAGDTRGVAGRLGELAVGVVLVPPAEATSTSTREHADLLSRLDGVPGLERVTSNEIGTVWRVSTDPGVTGAAQSVARARVTDADGAWLADLPAGAVDVRARLDEGPEGRLVVLAEQADERWSATLNGRGLPAVTLDDGRQAFEVPRAGGHLEIAHTAPWHTLVGAVQVAVLGVALVLGLPVRREGRVR